jgi:hypothetical protein
MVWLRISSIAAMVVLLPVPVAPTISTKPRFSMMRSLSIVGTFSESSDGIS